MPIKYNGTTVTKLIYNRTTVSKASYNGTQVFTSEEEVTPSWTLGGEGWTNTTWGSWSVGRNEGDLLIGTASATINTNGHSKMRITPAGLGFRVGRSRGGLRIYINGTEKYNLGPEQTRTTALDISLAGYSGNITVRVELQADWGYTDMYCSTKIKLFD